MNDPRMLQGNAPHKAPLPGFLPAEQWGTGRTPPESTSATVPLRGGRQVLSDKVEPPPNPSVYLHKCSHVESQFLKMKVERNSSWTLFYHKPRVLRCCGHGIQSLLQGKPTRSQTFNPTILPIPDEVHGRDRLCRKQS